MSNKTDDFKNYSLSIVIPAYNEEKTIRELVIQTNSLLKKITKNYEILVLDDGSVDSTYEILKVLKKEIPQLIIKHHRTNQGFGKTIKKLYFSAKKHLIFSLPGNGQIEPKELLKLIPYVDRYDMVIGKRELRYISLRRKLQSKIYNLLLRIIFKLPLTDINSVKLFKRKLLSETKLVSQSAFIDAELCYKFKNKGYKIIEIPIKHKPGSSRGSGGVATILPTIFEFCAFWFKNQFKADN